jgi:hypothetical protein
VAAALRRAHRRAVLTPAPLHPPPQFQLYAMRLLLGAFEAGATPCAYHMLASYYPYDRWVSF